MQYSSATECNSDYSKYHPCTLTQAIDGLLSEKRGYYFLNSESKEEFFSFAALKKEAQRFATAYRLSGVKPQDRVALILPDPKDFVLAFLGAVYCGAVPVPMYPPLSLGRLESYIENAVSILNASRACLLVTSKQVETVLWPTIARTPALKDIVTIDKLLKPSAYNVDFLPYRPLLDDHLFLQFTSGSTSEPKGVCVTHRSLYENVYVTHETLRTDQEVDHGVSWLPLYHDMGLIGFVLAPLYRELNITFIPTLQFIKRPTIWLETIQRKKATVSFAPNFAYALLTKRVNKEQATQLDLSSLKLLGCGAEPIQADTLQKFINHFAVSGLNPQVFVPSYGMAEATLAVTFCRPGSTYKVDKIDAHAYHEQGRAIPNENGQMSIVSCGFTFPNHEVRVVNEQGQKLPDRYVGEIIFKGPSVAAGYFDRQEATHAAFKEDWLHTGDLGYLVDGELFVCGRKKDLIIVNGRNYYPQTIEWSVEHVAGVRKGNVVAFSVPSEGSESLIVVCEAHAGVDAHTIKNHITQAVAGAFGLTPLDIVLLLPGTLPKTSSGKLQRQKTRALYLKNQLGAEGVRIAGSQTRRFLLARHLVRSWGIKVKHRLGKWWLSSESEFVN